MSQKKDLTVKFHSTKSTARIFEIIQISVINGKMEVVHSFSRCLACTRSIGKFNIIKFHGGKVNEKGPETLIKL